MEENKIETKEKGLVNWRLPPLEDLHYWTLKYERKTINITHPFQKNKNGELVNLSIEVNFEGMTTDGIPNGFGFVYFT